MDNTTELATSPVAMERHTAPASDMRTEARPAPALVVRPPIDVLESADGIRLCVDVPGVAAADAKVEVEMPHLRIDAERTLHDGTRVAYRASLRLPSSIDAASLSADMRHGVLTIAMSKAEQARARRITVRTA